MKLHNCNTCIFLIAILISWYKTCFRWQFPSPTSPTLLLIIVNIYKVLINSFITEVPVVDLQSKTIDYFLHDMDLRHGRVDAIYDGPLLTYGWGGVGGGQKGLPSLNLSHISYNDETWHSYTKNVRELL